MHWDVLMSEVLPAVQLPGASARRATALEMFGATHIPPSHRRMPHLLWTDSMTLISNLLMGGRRGRYTGSPDTLVLDQRIDLRGFSAGSFAGLSTLQLLWKIPNAVTNGKLGAIACPPHSSSFCTVRQMSHVCGSWVNANWISSRSAIHMFPVRALLIKSTLEPRSTTTLTGSRSIMRQGGGISPGSFSCTRRLPALLREMPLLCAHFRGLVFVLNQRWMSLLKPPCFIFPRWRR